MWPPAYKRWPSVHLPWGTVCPALSLRLLLLCAAHHLTHFKLPSCRSGIFGMTLADGSVGTTNGSMSAGGQDNDRLGWFYQRAEVKWRWRCRWRCSFARGRRLLVSGLQTDSLSLWATDVCGSTSGFGMKPCWMILCRSLNFTQMQWGYLLIFS